MTNTALSAGILLFRRLGPVPEVLLVHPGGPFWRHKDAGAWQIPKGLIEAGEAPSVAALREFEEELGHRPKGDPIALGDIRQKGGKRVIAFALEGDLDPAMIVSNSFEIEWPPKSGRRQAFPEVDRAQWFAVASARDMMLASQLPLLDALAGILADTALP